MIIKLRFILVLLLSMVVNIGDCQENRLSKFEAFDSLIYNDAILASQKLKALESQIKNEYERGHFLRRKAILARIEGKYNDALAYNLGSLEIFESIKDTLNIAEINHNLGYLLRYMKNYDLSISYYSKAIEFREHLKDSTSLALSHREIGVIYRRKKNYDKAKYHYNKAILLFDPVKDKDEILTLKGNYASLYHTQKKYDLAIQINKEALNTIRHSGKAKSLATRYGNISSAYYRLKQYEKADFYIDSALTVVRNANLLESNVRYTLQKANIANKQKKYKTAYKIMRKHKKISDSFALLSASTYVEKQMQSFEQKKKFLKDSMSLVMDKERLESSLQVENVKKKKTLWIVLFIILVMISISLWLLSRIKMTKLLAQNEKLISEVTKKKLELTQKENERLIDHSVLQRKFKKSIIDKVDRLDSENMKHEIIIRNIKQDLLDQLRFENQSQAVNKSIEDLPSSFDKFLRTKYSNLTKGERKVCFLVRRGLTIKEIANINDSSASAVQSMRYRIRKKMNLTRDQELQTFLLEMY